MTDAANTFFYGKGTQITMGLLRGLAIGALVGLAVGLALSYIPLLHGIPFILTGTQTINVGAIVSTAVGLGAAIGAPISAVKSYFYAEEHYSEKMGKIAGNKVALKGKILGKDKPLDHFRVHESEALLAPLRLNQTPAKVTSSEPTEVQADYLSNAPSYREKVRDAREQTISEPQNFIS